MTQEMDDATAPFWQAGFNSNNNNNTHGSPSTCPPVLTPQFDYVVVRWSDTAAAAHPQGPLTMYRVARRKETVEGPRARSAKASRR